MHLEDFSIYERSHCTTDALIINQTDHEAYEERVIGGHLVRMYSTTQRGLSRSRNMALIHAKGDYCLIADDDEVLSDDYEQKIIDAFSRNLYADAIAFNYYDTNSRTQNTKRKIIKKECEASANNFFSSVSLAFKREKVLMEGIWFNAKLGAGSGIISAGEESVWQSLARKKGLRIFQCPEYITTVSQVNSTWFNGFDEKYFYDLGANLTARYGIVKYIYQFYYPYRLRKETKLSIWKQICCINAGMQGFKKGMGYQQYIGMAKIATLLIVNTIFKGGGKYVVCKASIRE